MREVEGRLDAVGRLRCGLGKGAGKLLLRTARCAEKPDAESCFDVNSCCRGSRAQWGRCSGSDCVWRTWRPGVWWCCHATYTA